MRLAANDSEGLVAANAALHAAINALAGNKVLAEHIGLVERKWRWYYLPIAQPRGQDAWSEHAELIKAIAAQDVDARDRHHAPPHRADPPGLPRTATGQGRPAITARLRADACRAAAGSRRVRPAGTVPIVSGGHARHRRRVTRPSPRVPPPHRSGGRSCASGVVRVVRVRIRQHRPRLRPRFGHDDQQQRRRSKRVGLGMDK